MEELYWVWLTLAKGIGPVIGRKLIEHYGTASFIYENWAELEIKKSAERDDKAFEKAKEVFEECKRKHISVITFGNSAYMDKWKHMNDFPILLYTKGYINLKTMHGIGIVGARRCTQRGKQHAISIALEAVQEKKIVISGMAKGIDSYAHTAAVKGGGKTVAVLGNGADICYPPEHDKLYKAICENGAIVSEYPPGTNPQRYYFPRRNRIIAGLSEKIYVIEAGEKSGTCSTVQAAHEYGREVVSI